MSTLTMTAPYDPADTDAAKAYAAITGRLFVGGAVDDAFRHWQADPCNGGRADFAHVTKKQWVVHMYGLRDRHGAFLYPRWSWPESMGTPVSSPYNYNDQDAAVYYSQATNRLFAAGKIDEAYAHWRADPCGGAALSFCGMTKEQFAEGLYGLRDVQGNYLHPRPKVPVVESNASRPASPTDPLTIAYLALGAKTIMQKPEFAQCGHHVGELEFITDVIQFAPMLDALAEDRDFHAVYPYEVAEPFGEFIAETLMANGYVDEAIAKGKAIELINAASDIEDERSDIEESGPRP